MAHGDLLPTMMSSRFQTETTPFHFNSSRFHFIRFFVMMTFLILIARLFYVQAFLRSDLLRRAERELPKPVEAGSLRGKILDASGGILAESVQVESCYIDPRMIKDVHKTSATLARILGLNQAALLRDIRNAKTSFQWVRRNLTSDVAAKIRSAKLSGVGLKKEWRRHYPEGVLASHLLGLVGVDGQGLSGTEQEFDSTLLPAVPGKTTKSSGLPDGDVQLTIDVQIQKIAERELDWGVAQTKAKKGMVLIQDPWTGNLLAMASFPHVSLRPEDFPKPQDLRIPEVTDVFEPGSTYKIVTAAAALEENIVSMKELFSGEKGSWKVHDIVIHDHEPRGMMTFQDVMTYSSNIGTAKLSERLGAEKLFQYSRLFGFGVFPGTGLPGESKGMLRPLEKWSGVSPYVVSFGQEVGVTAIQMIGAYSAIANGGQLMEPKVTQAILSTKGEILWKNTPSLVRRVFSEKTAVTLTKILTNVVEQGTGQRAGIFWMKDFKVAGKTGTAQKYDTVTHTYKNNLTLVSFCGFFPADAPKYTMLVILDEPEGRRWGGTDAAPVFSRIAEQLSPKNKI
jgi:cell division protein FtsI (penicillin-binding protein 3)